MIKTVNLKVSKNIVGNFKAKIYEKIILNKKLDKEYQRYVYSSILDAEESLARGEKTYTWGEWGNITKEWDEENDKQKI